MRTESADELLKHLLERGLVSRRSAVDGAVVVVSDPAGAHFRVIDRRGPQLLVRSGGEAFEREAALGELVRDDPRFAALRPLFPRIVLIDRARELFVVETFAGANDAVEHHRLAGGPAEWFPARLGSWLAAWHRASTVLSPRTPVPQGVPPALMADGPLARSAPVVGQAIARVAAGWRPATFIHGDVDFEHVFVAPEPARRVQLVDWADARIGDPAWDIGTVIESYYAWSLDPDLVSTVEGPVCRLGGVDLRRVLSAFWGAYAATAQFAGAEARAALLRAVGYAGARLVARVDAMLDTPARAAVATPTVQAAVAMLTTPGVVADLVVGPTPARPQEMAVR